MPMSVMDAVKYGLPIVSTNVGSIPKVVHDGENRYCCEEGDVIKLAESIVTILMDKNIEDKTSEGSISIIEADYSIEHNLELIEQIYGRFNKTIER